MSEVNLEGATITVAGVSEPATSDRIAELDSAGTQYELADADGAVELVNHVSPRSPTE